MVAAAETEIYRPLSSGGRLNRFLPVVVVVLFGIGLSIAAGLMTRHTQTIEAQKTFEHAAQNYIEGLRTRVNEALLLDPANEHIESDSEFLALLEKQKTLIPIEGIESEFLREHELQSYIAEFHPYESLIYKDTVTLGNNRWVFLATPQPGYYTPKPWASLGVLLGGLGTTSMIGGYLFFMVRQRVRDRAVMAEQDCLHRKLESTIVELKQAQTDALDAKETAERANRAKSEFLATMSHEIRTPMNGILGMTELIMETGLNSKQHHYATTVMHSAEALLGIINDILDFSKIEAGRLDIEIIPFDLLQVVESSAELLAVKAREKALEIVVHYAPTTPRFVMGDPMRIRQILSNLLSNAIKFTEKGHIVIVTEAIAHTSAEMPSICISVQDTGIGIAPKARERIFEKFMQADSSTTRKFGGTGLGLSIAKQLAGLMGGELGVESVPGQGSKFWFTMALPPSNEPIDPLANFGASTSLLRDVRLLVVDDLAINNVILGEHLAQVHMQVDSCTNGVTALAMLREAKAQNSPFQMAIIDYLMPDMNGEELTRQIKADPAIRDIAIVMLTSFDGKNYLERFEKSGFSSLLSKPLRVQPLIETMATVWEMYKNGHTSGLIADDSFARRSHTANEAYFPGARILLAEDDRVNQEFAREILTGFHCDVTIAASGKEALDWARQQPFDLILMDCQMPGMDGFEASQRLNELKKSGNITNIPIIALTANAQNGDRERCLQAGMMDYANKPIRKEHLARILHKWLPARLVAQTPEDMSLEGIVVMVVEDNRINMEFAVEILKRFGCRSILARNGLESLSEVKKNQPYDIILMDVMMPEMDGLAATRQIRAWQKIGDIPTVPIVAITANAMKGDRELCLQAGMDDYLSKPLQGEQLKALLLQWIPREKLAAYSTAHAQNKQGNPLVNTDIIIEAKAVMGREFGHFMRLFIRNTESILNAIERCIRHARDPHSITIHAHSLRSTSGYMGAIRLCELSMDLEKTAQIASDSHGDITKIWPMYEELKFVWESTRRLMEAQI